MTWKSFLAGLKANLPFSGRRIVGFMGFQGLPDERDYTRWVGDGTGNSIVAACLQWIGRTFPEAPPAMWKVGEDAILQRNPFHPLVKLLRFPTAAPGMPGGFYSGILLWMATLLSWHADGNAYWLKVRSALGKPVQLWYVPHWMMEPRWPDNGTIYIDHYDYKVNGQVFPIAPSEVVHLRHGLDPENIRKGLSPLKAVLREVYTDEEAARFSASLLKNLGVPGVIFSPQSGTSFRPSQEELDKIKAKFKLTFGGDLRGEPMIMSGPTDIKQFGFSPQQLDLSAIRNVPEERITAALGLPAAVVGFGAGLQQTKVGATMAELREQAWQSNLIPSQRLMAEEIQTQLVPDFESDIERNQFGFDLTNVKVLQSDMLKLAQTWTSLGRAGFVKRREVRQVFGLVSDAEDDIYMPQPGVGNALQQEEAIQQEGDEPVDATAADSAGKQVLQQEVVDLTNQVRTAELEQLRTAAEVSSMVEELEQLRAAARRRR